MARAREQGSDWSSEQVQNARIIAQVGRQLGASTRDIQIALMTAMQESTLRNLDYGDRDSIGLFQQRNAWGSRSARLDPRQSAKMFFLGGQQGQRGLLDFKNRNSMELWQAAQKVQVSAFPRAYDKWHGSARSLMSQLGNVGAVEPELDPYKKNEYGGFEVPTPGPLQPWGSAPTPEMGIMSPQDMQPEMPNPNSPLTSAMDKILQDGLGAESSDGLSGTSESAIGVAAGDQPMDWTNWTPAQAMFPMPDAQAIGAFEDTFPSVKGGASAGATGTRSAVLNMAKKFIGTPYVFGGAKPGGFDCSGLVQYVMNEMGMKFPRLGRDQNRMGKHVALNKLQAGDLVYWQGKHIAFYLGNNMILEAPRTGLSVRIRQLGEWSQDAKAIGVALDY